MSKSRSPLLDFVTYVIVRFVVCVLQSLSPQTGRQIASGLAWLLYHIDRRHRLVADENLRLAFPGRYTDAQRDQMIRAVYLHFCTMLTELIHMPRRLHRNNWRNHIELGSGRAFVDLLLSGRPLLIVTGHFGNWELSGYALGLLGFPTYAVARPLDNAYLDRFLRGFRERTGQRILAKHGDFEHMQTALEQGGILATLADQDAGARGMFVDFFGRPASTHKAIALLSLQFRVPLLVSNTYKVGEPLHYRNELNDVFLPEEYDGQPDALRRMTQRFTAALERAVRKAPEQYFWLHRRWKHQPAAKKAKQAA
jgi:KDO2-lipid IV(A) lauroyltransferase